MFWGDQFRRWERTEGQWASPAGYPGSSDTGGQAEEEADTPAEERF